MMTRIIEVGEVFYLPSVNNLKWIVVDTNEDLVELVCDNLWAVETPARLVDPNGSWVSRENLHDS
jgi:hypothetical protein